MKLIQVFLKKIPYFSISLISQQPRNRFQTFSFFLKAGIHFYALATKNLGIGMSVGLSVGLSVGYNRTFKKVWTTSCEVYTVQTVFTGRGPSTVHVYTRSWAEHSQE